jgi:hypothetical protein
MKYLSCITSFPGTEQQLGFTGDLEVRCPAQLLLESSLRAYVTTAGIGWDKTSPHPTAARIQ